MHPTKKLNRSNHEESSAEKDQENFFIIPNLASTLEHYEDDLLSTLGQSEYDKQQYVEQIEALQEELAGVKGQLQTEETTSSSKKSIINFFRPITSSPTCVVDTNSTIKSKSQNFIVNSNNSVSVASSSKRSILFPPSLRSGLSKSTNTVPSNIKTQFRIKRAVSEGKITGDNKSQKLLPMLMSTLPSLVNGPPASVCSSAEFGTSASVSLLTMCTVNCTAFDNEEEK